MNLDAMGDWKIMDLNQPSIGSQHLVHQLQGMNHALGFNSSE